MRTCLRTLEACAAWGLLLLPALAAWFYGGTRPWTIQLLAWLAYALALPVLASRCRDLPRGWALLAPVCAGWILVQGWCMTLLPRMLYREDLGAFQIIHRHWADILPGVIDQRASLPVMVRITALLAVLFAAMLLFRETRWQKRFLMVILAGASSVLILGILQKFARAPGIFWEPRRPPGTFFATWFYHGNAASFMAMVFPLLLAGFFAFRGKWMRAGFGAACLLCISGAWLNVSKAGFPLLTLGAGLFFCGTFLAKLLPRVAAHGVVHRRSILSVLGAIVIGALVFPFYAPSAPRWRELASDISRDYPRLLIAEVTVSMVPDAGAFGFGPGTWRLALPHYSHPIGNRAPGVWRYAHQDYLQHLVEWGWLGIVPWAVLLVGGMIRGWWTLLKHRPPGGDSDATVERFFLLACLCALATGCVHALFDFPFQILSLQLLAVFALARAWCVPPPLLVSKLAIDRAPQGLPASNSGPTT